TSFSRDWSSDVCSSDLRIHAWPWPCHWPSDDCGLNERPVSLVLVIELQRCLQRRPVLEGADDRQVQVVVAQDAVRHALHVLDGEIGRASCRERDLVTAV